MNFIVNYYQGNFKLLLIACNEEEQKFLESHIGEIVELHPSSSQSLQPAETCDCGLPFPQNGYCKFCGSRQQEAVE